MTFLKYKGDDYWWKWPEEGTTVFNFNGGYHDIDENSERFMYGEIVRAEDWHDLYVKTGYNPLETNRPTPDMWIDPEGVMYECSAHEVVARQLLDIIYGENIRDIWDCGDILVARGWIKVTTSLMYSQYMIDGMYDNMTREQLKSWYKWHLAYGR